MDHSKVNGPMALDTWLDMLDLVKTVSDREGALILTYFTTAMATNTEYSTADQNRATYLMRDAIQYVATQYTDSEY